MEIKKGHIATSGLGDWEQTGTIAIDFANRLDRLNQIEGINLQSEVLGAWRQVGFRFGSSLIENSDNITLDIVLSKVVNNENTQFGFVTRQVKKKDFLDLVVGFTAYVSNQVYFVDDDINFRQLSNLEE